MLVLLCFILIYFERLFSFATGFPPIPRSTLAWPHLDRSQRLYSQLQLFTSSALIIAGRQAPGADRSRAVLPEYVHWRREPFRERSWQPQEPSSSSTTEPIPGRDPLGHAQNDNTKQAHTKEIHTHVYTHAHIHTHTLSLSYSHTHTCTHKHAHTHTALLPGARKISYHSASSCLSNTILQSPWSAKSQRSRTPDTQLFSSRTRSACRYHRCTHACEGSLSYCPRESDHGVTSPGVRRDSIDKPLAIRF
jgi:hypothetical protein